jgi:hypothetical protein
MTNPYWRERLHGIVFDWIAGKKLDYPVFEMERLENFIEAELDSQVKICATCHPDPRACDNCGKVKCKNKIGSTAYNSACRQAGGGGDWMEKLREAKKLRESLSSDQTDT